jgi:hypothetical protein
MEFQDIAVKALVDELISHYFLFSAGATRISVSSKAGACNA